MGVSGIYDHGYTGGVMVNDSDFLIVEPSFGNIGDCYIHLRADTVGNGMAPSLSLPRLWFMSKTCITISLFTKDILTI